MLFESMSGEEKKEEGIGSESDANNPTNCSRMVHKTQLITPDSELLDSENREDPSNTIVVARLVNPYANNPPLDRKDSDRNTEVESPTRKELTLESSTEMESPDKKIQSPNNFFQKKTFSQADFSGPELEKVASISEYLGQSSTAEKEAGLQKKTVDRKQELASKNELKLIVCSQWYKMFSEIARQLEALHNADENNQILIQGWYYYTKQSLTSLSSFQFLQERFGSPQDSSLMAIPDKADVAKSLKELTPRYWHNCLDCLDGEPSKAEVLYNLWELHSKTCKQKAEFDKLIQCIYSAECVGGKFRNDPDYLKGVVKSFDKAVQGTPEDSAKEIESRKLHLLNALF